MQVLLPEVPQHGHFVDSKGLDTWSLMISLVVADMVVVVVVVVVVCSREREIGESVLIVVHRSEFVMHEMIGLLVSHLEAVVSVLVRGHSPAPWCTAGEGSEPVDEALPVAHPLRRPERKRI